MNSFINPAFIELRPLTVNTENGVEQIEVLAFNRKANDACVRKLNSFSETLRDFPETEIGSWEISNAFIDEHVCEFILTEMEGRKQLYPELDATEFEPTILGYPITIVDSAEPYCIFHSSQGKVDNVYW